MEPMNFVMPNFGTSDVWKRIRRSSAAAKGHATRKDRARVRIVRECKAAIRETLVRGMERTVQNVIHAHNPAHATHNVFPTSAVAGDDRDEAGQAVAHALLSLAVECGAIVAEGEGHWRVIDGEALYEGQFSRGVTRLVYATA